MDYYNILNISKDASDDEIKKAYKKMALKYHPDKNGGNDEQFKKISEAYEILSDPDKRQIYDSGGDPKSQNMNFGNQTNDIHNIFQQFFGNATHNHFNNFNFRQHHHQQRQANIKRGNHMHKINVSLKDIHFGIKKNIKVIIKKNCFDCKVKCTECDGSGQKTHHRQMGPMTQIITQTCNACGGSGKLIKKSQFNKCETCQGTSEIKEEKMLVLDITKCFKNDVSMLFEGLGEQPENPGEIPGDLIFQINIIEDQTFKRIGDSNDLEYTINLSLLESLIGTNVRIPHFDEDFLFNTGVFGIINPNEKYIIPNKGLGNMGNLIIKFKISYPKGKMRSSDSDRLIQIFDNIQN